MTYFSFWVGNPQDVLKFIADRHKLEPTGDPSLQNAIEIARGSMKCVSKFLFFFCFLTLTYSIYLSVTFQPTHLVKL